MNFNYKIVFIKLLKFRFKFILILWKFYIFNKGLLLSSSFDWSITLWNPFKTVEPLNKIEFSENYVFDVKWNPVEYTMFASCDGDGFIDVWGLNNLEEPRIHF